MNLDNNSLLSDYYGSRRIKETTKGVYQFSLNHWDRNTHVSLSKARVGDVKKWFKTASTLKPGTIALYAKCLRALYEFSLVSGGAKKRVAKIKAGELWELVPFRDLDKEAKTTLRDKVLSQSEVETILKEAKHPRVRAILAVLIESGCRKGELRTLKIRDVSFRDTIAEIRVSGKTGERTLPLIHSVPYLRAWLQVHPNRVPDEWLFTTESGKPMYSTTINSTLENIVKKSKLRNIHPHMLRHTALTHLAKSGLSEYQLKTYAGWTTGSMMPERYIHLSGREHINPVLEAQGYAVPQEAKPRPLLSLGKCPKCDLSINPDMLYCPSCGFILDESLRAETREVQGQTDETVKAAIEFLKNLGFKPPG
jgi:integrase